MSATTTVLIPTGTWNVDPKHSGIEFRVKHLGIATVRGSFREFEGTLEVPDDISGARAYGKVNAASINTNEDARDEHLRSADFFDAENYPEITFESTAITPLDEDTFSITGNLTLHGITNEITLTADVNGTEQDPWGNERVGVQAEGTINRSDFDMKFNQALGSGNLVVSDKVNINLDISAVKAA
jgi:polyisoprenoid-binding protein YceI